MPFAPKNTPVIRKNLDEQTHKKRNKKRKAKEKKKKSAGRLTEDTDNKKE